MTRRSTSGQFAHIEDPELRRKLQQVTPEHEAVEANIERISREPRSDLHFLDLFPIARLGPWFVSAVRWMRIPAVGRSGRKSDARTRSTSSVYCLLFSSRTMPGSEGKKQRSEGHRYSPICGGVPNPCRTRAVSGSIVRRK